MGPSDLISMPGGYDLRVFDVLDSTNAECRRIGDGGEQGNVWVVAKSQTSGKGRRGREWVSRSGNLFASLLYKLDCDLRTASELSFVTALAVRDTVADLLQNSDAVTCKWPNDILVRGHKISGILLETAGHGGEAPSHVIIGIGVNIGHHPDDAQFPATNLKSETGADIPYEQVMQSLASSMARWTEAWQKAGFSAIRKAWKSHASGLGQEVIVRLPDEELTGRFIDLDDSGALILEFGEERRHITAGDVFFA